MCSLEWQRCIAALNGHPRGGYLAVRGSFNGLLPGVALFLEGKGGGRVCDSVVGDVPIGTVLMLSNVSTDAINLRA